MSDSKLLDGQQVEVGLILQNIFPVAG